MTESGNERPRGVSALILAGGRARRLGGVDKRGLVIGGKTVFDRQVAVLAPCVDEIIVAAPDAVAGYRAVPDAVAGGGPLAGIAAGLAASRTPWLLVVAGDMPNLSKAVIFLITERIQRGSDPPPDAVGIRIGDRPEPLLCALRCAGCTPVVARRLARGELKVATLLLGTELLVDWVDEAALRAADPELTSLVNLNTPEDVAAAIRRGG